MNDREVSETTDETRQAENPEKEES